MKKLMVLMMVLAMALVAVPAMVATTVAADTGVDVPVEITVAKWCSMTVGSGTLTVDVNGINDTTPGNPVGVSVSANAAGQIGLSGDTATYTADGITHKIGFTATLYNSDNTEDNSFSLGDEDFTLNIASDESYDGSYVAPGTYTGTVTVTATLTQ